MGRLLACCALSIGLYAAAFGFVVARPLSLGFLQLEMAQKSARLASLGSPKLVILAGSNGPYSHSCRVIGAMLDMPCENAGIAVGIGLDDLFARYRPDLRRGDVVYMPMEVQQYATTRRQNDAAIDGAILVRFDHKMLLDLPPDRLAGAVFSNSFNDFLEAVAEAPFAAAGVLSARDMLAQKYDSQGDRIGTSLATADRQVLLDAARTEPGPEEIATGYGSRIIGQFVAAETGRGVIVIGGLPTDFASVKLPAATVAAIRSVYQSNGGLFAALPNESRYPRADFYDSEDHLALPCQYFHSIAVARLLASILHRKPRQADAGMLAQAARCPAQN
jgi:hypothetical protein